MLLGTGCFECGLIADVAAHAGVIRINDAAKALRFMLEKWPREAQRREIVGTAENLVRSLAAKFEDFVHPFIGPSNVVRAAPRIHEVGSIDSLFPKEGCILHVICREMARVGEMLLQKFGNRIECGVNLLLKNLVEVAWVIRRFHAEGSATLTEEQSFRHQFEVLRNGSIRLAIEEFSNGDSSD